MVRSDLTTNGLYLLPFKRNQLVAGWQLGGVFYFFPRARLSAWEHLPQAPPTSGREPITIPIMWPTIRAAIVSQSTQERNDRASKRTRILRRQSELFLSRQSVS